MFVCWKVIMDTRKRIVQTVLANTKNEQSGRTSFLNCIIAVMIALELSSHCKAQCSNPGETLEISRPQRLKSTNYPDPYPDNVPCSWKIAVPDAEPTWRIQVRVVDVDFPCCCDSDYLLIKDGFNSAARSIVALCSAGRILNPTTITSSGSTLYGEFINDGETTNADERTSSGYSLQFIYFDSKVSCPSGWVSSRGFCYKLHNEPLHWQQAASRCGYDGGFLTSIVDREENDFLLEHFGNETSLAWIGMNSSMRWLDGSSSLQFKNFRYPRISESRCFTLELDKRGTWSDSDCEHEQNNFICKKTQDGSGGRYWTEVVLSDRKGDSSSKINVKQIIIWPIMVVIFLVMACFSGRRELWLYTIMKDCMKSFINSCAGCIRVALTPCSVCLERIRQCYQMRTTRTPSTASSHPTTPEPMNRAPLAQNIISRSSSTSSESDDHPRREFGTTQSPSTYSDDDEVISVAPPPSYIYALAPTFDLSYNDPRGSGTSMNARESIAAPSYDYAVAGFQTTV